MTTDGSLASSRHRIEKFEIYHGLRFPKDYRDFLLKAGRAQPERSCFMSSRGREVLERFLPLFDDPNTDPTRGGYDIAVVLTQLNTRLTDGGNQEDVVLVPIAAMFAGDFVVLDYRANRDSPQIAVWSHEASDDFAPETHFVCASFSNLLKGLHKCE